MSSSLALRVGQTGPGDPDVERLSRLDSVKPLTGLVLVAAAEGGPIAALSVDDGRVAADPFLPTVDAVAVLRVRAAQLQPSASGGLRRRLAGRHAHRGPAMRAA
ncbi:MAG TPA: hypothetical protein VHF45_00595 [Thermoleophilaceae bacterium]|nr:hypothetical protein [Thermoleophilaceae bacterium]